MNRLSGDISKPPSNASDSVELAPSAYDHAPRFIAFAQHQEELTARLETLLRDSEPQSIEVRDPESRILLSADEISRLWGLFPENARNRAVTNPPVIKSDTARWFARGSSPSGSLITDKAEEALSPTAHGLAHTDEETNDRGVITSAAITFHEIPDNGFSSGVERLVQAGVVVHELAHTVVDQDISDSRRHLVFPTGNRLAAAQWIALFAETAEQYAPISRYSSAYRNGDNTFPRVGEAYEGVPILEELVDSITAELLGFVVSPQGLTFKPFKGREELQKGVQAYLNAQPS